MSRKQKSVLMVCSEPVYPARLNGISIRYAPIIESLADEIDIDVAMILRSGVSIENPTGLQKFCRNIYCLQRTSTPPPLLKRLLVRLAKCFPVGTPYTHYCYDSKYIATFLKELSHKKAYDRIIWVSSAYLDIGISVFGAKNIVLDSIDSVYNQFRRKKARRAFDIFDRLHLKQWEFRSIEKTRATIFVSEADAAMYWTSPSLKKKVYKIPNGVYVADQPGIDDTRQHQADDHRPAVVRLGFLGNMGYQPNIDAALRLKRIFDTARATYPNLELSIIGRAPAQAVMDLAASEGITVTGTVDNIWAHVNAVDIFVFPMVSGGGQQNKLLETMIAQKAVITNKLANSGVGAEPNTHLIICDSDDQFAQAITELATDTERRKEIAAAGRLFIENTYEWKSIIPQLKTAYFFENTDSVAR